MSTTAANKLDRIIGVLFWLQLVIGIVLAISWPVALKAPGPLAGAALTLLFRTLMRRGTLTSSRAVAATSLVLVLGVVYPWPWVSDVDETTEKAAQVRRLAGPEGCICLAIAGHHLGAQGEIRWSTAAFVCSKVMNECHAG